MPQYINNPVRLIAAEDYRPDIVKVSETAIAALVAPDNLESMGSSLGKSPLAAIPQTFIPYFIVMNAMNYQFWDVTADGTFQRYSHNGKVGALAMQESFHAAWLEALGDNTQYTGHSLASRLSHRLASRIANEGVGFIFGDIPDTASRQELLLEVLNPAKLTLASDYLAARALNTGELGWGDAQLLAYLFPQSYGDRYLKKAQLTLMFIAGEWNAQRPNWDISHRPCDLDVTAAADYQLPKVGRTKGLLEYSPELAALVDMAKLIPANSPFERAIRAATVKMCDLVALQFNRSIGEVDFWFWLNRNVDREAKFHLTRTTAY